MRIYQVLLTLSMLLLHACQKKAPIDPLSTITSDTTTQYTIRRSNHYCDQTRLKSISTSQMNFLVKFNESAIYTTQDPINQTDINKLLGFSEGSDHQLNSARIGWAYHTGALRLFAYVYDNGVRSFREITTVALNTQIPCSIKLAGSTYLISANGQSVTMSRGLSTPQAIGYQLYPYFGGDETAPQDITIYLK